MHGFRRRHSSIHPADWTARQRAGRLLEPSPAEVEQLSSNSTTTTMMATNQRRRHDLDVSCVAALSSSVRKPGLSFSISPTHPSLCSPLEPQRRSLSRHPRPPPHTTLRTHRAIRSIAVPVPEGNNTPPSLSHSLTLYLAIDSDSDTYSVEPAPGRVAHCRTDAYSQI